MIVKANEAQIEEIITLHAVKSMGEGTLHLNSPLDEQRVRQMIASLLERGGSFYVALEEQQIVGYVLIGTTKDFFSEDVVGYIYELYVLPEHRRKGYAKQLLSEAHQVLKESGLTEVRLNVFIGNPGENLYQSLGYKDRNKIMSLPL